MNADDRGFLWNITMSHILDSNVAEPLPDSPLSLYLALTQGALQPHEFWRSRHFRLKFFLRSLVMPVKTYQLLKLITRHPAYEELLKRQPRLPCRIQRPYLCVALSSAERTQAILCHYRTLTPVLGREGFNKHLSSEGICLSQLPGKDGQMITLQFISTYRLDKEGEASIIFRDGTGQMLAEITFIICIRNNKKTVIIGGLQGPNNDNAQEIVQQATKNIYGLFPKRFVLQALLCLSDTLNVEQVLAVSNRLHVYRSARYRNRVQYIHADYNSLWEMCDGVLNSEGFYSIPVKVARKSIEDVPSKKRAEYRRRYELTDAMCAQIRNTFSQTISIFPSVHGQV